MIDAQDDILVRDGEIDRAVPGSVASPTLKCGLCMAEEKIDELISHGIIAEGGTGLGGPGSICTATAR